jgi:predicted nicotinamide N-methyase
VFAREFVLAHTRLVSPPCLPELRLHLAGEPFAVWREAGRLPYWAFAWVGGRALARHVLDHPPLVAGRHVLDVASGSGLVALAAARAGAAHVVASDVDPLAVAAIALNAEANGLEVAGQLQDVLDRGAAEAEVVLAGDVFYERALAERVLPFLERARAGGAAVLVGDSGRAYFPTARFEEIARYDLPAAGALEDADVKPAMVWRLTGPARRPRADNLVS